MPIKPLQEGSFMNENQGAQEQHQAELDPQELQAMELLQK